MMQKSSLSLSLLHKFLVVLLNSPKGHHGMEVTLGFGSDFLFDYKLC